MSTTKSYPSPLSTDVAADNDDTNGKIDADTIAAAEVEMNRVVDDQALLSHQNGGTQFGKFYIPEECIFYRTKLSAAFVNLRPIVPSHVLVIPMIDTPSKAFKTHLCDLSDVEYYDLWRTVRFVQTILQHHFHKNHRDSVSTTPPQCLSYNVAVQDGKEAGQSVFHVHVHILPRIPNDFENNDDVYEELDRWEPREQPQWSSSSTTDSSNLKQVQRVYVPDDQERKDRTMIEMTTEAAMYRQVVMDLEQQQQQPPC